MRHAGRFFVHFLTPIKLNAFLAISFLDRCVYSRDPAPPISGARVGLFVADARTRASTDKSVAGKPFEQPRSRVYISEKRTSRSERPRRFQASLRRHWQTPEERERTLQSRLNMPPRSVLVIF
jgi:hypothetical protein